MRPDFADRLRELAHSNVFIGTSSWKYPGWKGLVYRRDYRSEKAFNETCLEEYGETFTAVGVDHTYYNWPTEKGFQKYVDQTPPAMRFGLKVTDRITILRYPRLARFGKEAGKDNPDFLDPDLFVEKFLGPLRPFQDRIGPLMLEFSRFYPGMLESGSEFVARLDRFFSALAGEKGWQLGVEMRNEGWLKPPYFECLARHGATHVLNSWTKMPPLEEQLALTEGYPFPALVSRVLLQPGTKYEEAVEAFAPYDRVQEEAPALRRGAAALIRRAIALGKPAYVFVNNRAEGCAPRTIEGVLDLLEDYRISDSGTDSPLRRARVASAKNESAEPK